MEYIVNVFVPLAIALLMLSVGLSTTKSDFKKMAKHPRDFALGLFMQIILVPATGFLITLVGLKYFSMSKDAALGLLILAACPGGVTSNAFTLLSKGNLALSICLTTTTSLLALVTMPLFVTYYTSWLFPGLLDGGGGVLKIAASLFLATTFPLILGLIIRYLFPVFVQKHESKLSPVVLAGLFLIILVATWQNQHLVADNAFTLLPLATLFTATTLLLAAVVTRLSKEDEKTRITLIYECGFQSTALSVYICMNLIQNEPAALVAALNTFPMYILATMVMWFYRPKTTAQVA